jgi:hypothetical protein
MSELEEVPEGVDLARGEADLAAAVEQLRTQPPSERAHETAGRVLRAAMSAPRRAVVLDTAHDGLQVSSVAVVALLRDALARALVDSAVRRIRLDHDGPTLTRVTVEVVVRYGSSVPDLAAFVGQAVRSVLLDALGPGPAPGAAGVVDHVHVSDVTLGDPELVEPLDEDVEPA